MGELIYIVNLDKKEYISKANKMREWELNPKELLLLFAMLQTDWAGNRIQLISQLSIDRLGKLDNVTKKAEEIAQEFKFN